MEGVSCLKLTIVKGKLKLSAPRGFLLTSRIIWFKARIFWTNILSESELHKKKKY